MADVALSTGIDVLIARRHARLKQWELAARLGVSSTVLCDIEHGRRLVTPDLALRIAAALRLTVAAKIAATAR